MLRSIGLFIALLCGVAHAVEVKPEINGTYEASCRLTASSAPCDVASAGKPSFYGAQVAISTNVSYVTFRDIYIKDVAGVGFGIELDAHHIVVDNIEVAFTATAALDLRRNQQTHIKNSSWHDSGICLWQWRGTMCSVPDNVSSLCRDAPGGPALIELGGMGHSTAAYGIFENNDAYVEYNGELLGVGYHSGGNFWVIGNRIRQGKRNGIYVAASGRNLIENNIRWNYDNSSRSPAIVGTKCNGDAYEDSETRGIDIAVETFETVVQNYSDNIVRNNIFAGVDDALFYAGVFPARTVNIGAPGVQYYHNLVVGHTGEGVVADRNKTGSSWNDHYELVNNIIYSDVESAMCSSRAASNWADFEMGPNYWESTPDDVDCREATDNNGPYDDVIGNPNLARSRDSWNESDWTVDSGPSLADAVLQAGDSGLNAGRPLQTAISWLDDANFDYFSEVTTCSFTASEWEKQAAYDINCNLRSATTPNLGADETN